MHCAIDIDGWERRAAFEFFKDFEDPFFNMTANVNVSRLYSHCRSAGLSFSLAGLYCSLQAANSVREFRLRFMHDEVVEFDLIHGTQTILNPDETFSFCYFEMKESIAEFDAAGKIAREKYGRLRTFDVETDRLDLIYFSVIPWVSFTSFKHASRRNNRQSVPRIVFGKVFKSGEEMLMPVSVELHHSLADGIHVGKFYQRFQATINAL